MYCVYLLANKPRGTLYLGVTADLVQRVWQHKNQLADGFTKKYRIHDLMWYEAHEDVHAALAREKAMKGWKRIWKIELIEKANSQWRDLYDDILGGKLT